MADSKSNEAVLAALLKERERLLTEHPELRPLQSEIDYQLSKVGPDPGHRIAKMFDMMGDIIENELRPELKNLKEKVEEFILADQKIRTIKRRAG
jgi:tRNA G37 N-methylase Trm5